MPEHLTEPARAATGTDPVIAVFAPDPLLTVTIEARGDDAEVHLHAGGQGCWLARMMTTLGAAAVLCGPFGGETGIVVRTLMEREGIVVRGVSADSDNGAYVHDRRGGQRDVIVEMHPPLLSRHAADELFAVMLVEALEADAAVLGGPQAPDVVPADTFRRLAADLSAAGKLVVADLSGDDLAAALEGGVSVLKVSHASLIADGRAADGSPGALVEALYALQDAGAARVVLTRAEEPALALSDRVVSVSPPRLEPLDSRGAGDSLTAALATSLARGADWESALRSGAAAGALNTARRGLGTGARDEIERLAAHVRVEPFSAEDAVDPRVVTTTPRDLAARTRSA